MDGILHQDRNSERRAAFTAPDDEPFGYHGERRFFAQPEAIHRIFEERLQASPIAGKVKFADAVVDYAELNDRANQLSRWLSGKGIGRGDLVGICLEPSVELIATLLAILKAGAGFVSLDIGHPRERLEFVASDSGMKAVLYGESTRGICPTSPALVLDLESAQREAASHSTDNRDIEGSSNDVIYVMYTSGSTGNPKGCILTHGGIRNRLLWGIEEYELGPGASVLFKTSISFDVSVWEIFAPLLSGADLVVAKQGATKDASYIIGLINEHRITHADFVPSMMSTFLTELKFGDCKTLRVVTCAGEALTAGLLDRIFGALQVRVYNLCGPTETSLAVTYWSCTTTPPDREVPIGRPMANVSLYVLDAEAKPVHEGGSGELYVGGVAVGRGYLNLPGKTAESFVVSPFLGSERLYRTGDFVRVRQGGEFMYLGRSDQQVKLRGARIELGEIEAQLASNQLIRDAVVLVREFDIDDERLVAYVALHAGIPREGDRANLVRQLRSSLQKTLPIQMIPAHFVIFESLPLTDNGKADRKSLLALPVNRTPVSVEQPIAQLVTQDIERRLTEVWCQVLGVDKIDRSDDFFELGGHSLLAAKVVTLLKPQYKLSIQEVFQHPTIQNLTALIASRQTS
jgi:amino acid adenylation domain-containing protein